MSDEAARKEACREYQSSLEDLTFNSKPHINMLTILAEENLQFTKDIVAIIEAQIAKAPPAEKLPVLYLVDSIVKNVGGEYLEVFAKNLVTSFICVFEKVDENTRKSLFKLRSTWDEIFPLKKLYSLDVRVNAIDPAWPIKPLPPNVNASIHVNPKFLKPTEEAASTRVITPQPQVHPTVAEKSLTKEQIIRQQLLAKQKQLLELQQKKIELELEQTKAQLAASTNNPPVSAQAQFDPVPVVSQPGPTSYNKSWPSAAADKMSTRDPRLNRATATSINTKEQGTYKKESQNTPSVNAVEKRLVSTERPSKLMRIPKKDTSATEEKAKSKSVPTSSKGILNKSKDFELEHTKTSDLNKKDPRLRKQMHEKADPKEDDMKEKKRSEKKERDDAPKGTEQQRSTNSRGKLVNGSLNKHERLETFQKQEIKVNKANLRKRSRSRSRSPPAHSPKRKERRSPKRRTRSITPPSKSGKGRQLSKHPHSEDTIQQSNVREDRSTPKKSIAEQRRLKRPLDERPLEHREAQTQRASPAEHKSIKDGKKWRSGWEENKPLKQPEPDLSHSKPGPPRHKTWSNQRPATPRTPKQHRLSVDANLQIPEVLNSANKRDLLRKASQRLADGELSHDDFLNVAHQIKQLFQYQEERQRSDSWEGSSDDGSYTSKRPSHGQMSDAELSYFEHKSKLRRTQLQRPVRQNPPLSENMLHHRPQHEEDDPLSETSDAHKKGSDTLKPFSGHDDPRRNDRPPSRTGPVIRNSQSPVNCDGISGKSPAAPFEGSSPPMDMEPFDDGEISPRFESPNSVHSGTGPDSEGPLSLETPLRHDIISGPGRSGRTLVESPGHTPPHSSEGPNTQTNILRHDGMTIPPRFDGHKSSHPSFEGPHGHMVQPRTDGLCRPHPPGRYEGNTGPGRYDGPGGHVPSRYDGHGRYDTHAPNRFERPPLLKGPGRYDNQPVTHGPGRYGEPHGVGRFDGPGTGRFDGPVGHQGPGRFDSPGPMRFDNPAQTNRFDGPTRFDSPHMPPGPPGGFDGPIRFPAGPGNFEGRRLEGPGNQTGIMRFDTPVQPTPMRFDGQPPGMTRFDTPQGPPRYRGPPNMQNALRPQGQTMFDQPQSQGPVLNTAVLPPNFNMAPPNAFGGQPQPFHIQQDVSQASNFNVTGSAPSGFQNSYRPVTPFPGAGNPPQPMAMLPAPGQTFIQNPVPFNPPISQFVQPESHLGQMDVNDLVAKLITSGIIKPTQTESSSESTLVPQSQSVPEEEEPEEQEEEEDENLPDLTSFALDDMKQRHECVITKLYTGIQCYSCGMRFTASQTDVYADHLDWHYRQNRSEKDISKKVTHRRWYYSLTDWIEFEEIADLEERAKSQFFEKVHEEVVQKTQEAAKEREFQSVKAAPDVVDESCEICQEQFEMYWEEEEEEWHLKNAMRDDGKTYHPSCYEDYKNTSSFVDCTPSPNKMLTENPLNAFLKQEREGEASCSSIKEEPAEENTDTVTVKEEVQVKLEGESQTTSAIIF